MLEESEHIPIFREAFEKARWESLKKGLLDGMVEGMKLGVKQGMQQGIRGDIIELLKNRLQAVDGIEEIILTINEI